MKRIKQYKPFIAAAFLLLYCFIATPVNYWHHHSDCKQQQKSSTSSLITKESFGSDASCKICNHHYSVSDDTMAFTCLPAVIVYNDYLFDYAVKKIINPGYSQSNKGPPASA